MNDIRDEKTVGEIKMELGMGWLPDYPDYRDYTVKKNEISSMLKLAGQGDSVKTMLKKVDAAETSSPETLKNKEDLRKWCSPIEDQKSLGSCTANAGVGVVEYFERRAFGRHIDSSRLFLYKATRNLMNVTGDTGAYLRSTMGALVLFGVPPEEYWPYKIEDFEIEPSPFCYAFAKNYQAIQYVRLDPQDTSKEELLNRIKTNLAVGLPSIFGFTVYSSISQAIDTGEIPFPCEGDKIEGGHAIVAVGYDDNKRIKNTTREEEETTGALLIRNSWGTKWGEKGYGWLPYDYVLNELAMDWWSLLKNDWIDTGEFGF